MRDLKYLAALTIPLSAVVSLYFKGYWSYFTPFYAFVVIPIMEILLPEDTKNLDQSERENKSNQRVFDWMLYLNLPIVYGLLIAYLVSITSQDLLLYEVLGLMVSLGIVLGANGINVGHELGHRQKSRDRYLGKALLLPSFYMHFYIEHNFGHHMHAATREDPATARLNQTVYSFWFTSVFRQYVNAWHIQRKLLRQQGLGFFSVKNDMFWYLILEAAFLVTIYFLFGLVAVGFVLGAGVVGFLLLETVNYIEHYGLLRKKMPSGRYERVREIHSWNSNHIIGRIVLYELTRHSDHHYKSSKKYQLLDCHEESPQMPFGYPTSMVMSFLPPLWFRVMNPRIPEYMKEA
ncbi:MAG: alkane 1-monooxygenase [Flavobacteriaceae bacterium]|nr:alkane 1-monooxygenase [Eudoraea sp.]NNJ38058.1 alkane 1-monooxygenase [Flavobacteriaceae bacterium]